jgi:hypothetical protein
MKFNLSIVKNDKIIKKQHKKFSEREREETYYPCNDVE